MASLLPDFQQYIDLRDGTILGIHKVTLKSTSDTITTPVGANSTASASVAQIRDAGEAAVTVTSSSNTITIASGTAGNTVTIASLHRNVNYGAEA
jgi:hypothetical protein